MTGQRNIIYNAKSLQLINFKLSKFQLSSILNKVFTLCYFNALKFRWKYYAKISEV